MSTEREPTDWLTDLQMIQNTAGATDGHWPDEFMAWYEPDRWMGVHRAACVFIGSKLRDSAAEITSLRADAERRDEVLIQAYVIQAARFKPEVRIERTRQIEGPPKWSVRLNGDCLNKTGEWEWEPNPSGREDDFLARCRFDSADEAIAAAVASQSAQNESTKTNSDAAIQSGEAKK